MARKNCMSFIEAFRVVIGILLVFSLAASGVAAGQNPVPLINQPLVPDATKPGGAGFTLTINGTGFVSASVVKWNGSARATTFVSASKLKASIVASDIAKPTTASVTVVNPGPGGGTSNVGFFVVRVPALVSLDRADYAVGDGPNSLAVGDFNQDGKLDLVTSNYFVNTVSVLLGNGDGAFQSHVDYATELGPDTVVVGDFNRDGKLDLAVRNQSSNTVSVLLGNGDGTFQPAASFAVGAATGASCVAVGDFNGDGNLDLVASNHDANTISVLLGKGDGTFQNQVVYAAGSGPSAIGVGDLNGDGKLDLVLANSNDVVSVMLGNGDGSFQVPVAYATAQGPGWINLADLNGDGILDLVVDATPSSAVSVLLGNGDGTLKPHRDFAVASGANRSELADLNGDGKLDLMVVSRYGSDVVSVLHGNGDGTFQPPVTFAAGAMPEAVAVGDFYGEGRLDLAVADNSTPGEVFVLLQASTVSLSPTSLTFAGQLVGTSSTAEQVTLTNSGYLRLSITGISITGTDAIDFREANNCPSSLAVGAHCTIEVTFASTQAGPRTASVTITDDGVGSPQAIALRGTGIVTGPNVTLSPTSLTFATQLVGTTSSTQPVTLANYGTATVTITSINFTGANPGDFIQTNTCDGRVAADASCTISVSFKPTHGGSRTASLTFTDDAPGSPQTVALSGTGTVVKLNPNSLSFGVHPVGTTATLSTSLTNVGSTALAITGIAVIGADHDEFSQINTCGSSVAAGKTCTIGVIFGPSERGGDSAAVSISDDGGGSPQEVSLSGTGCVYGYRHKCLPSIGRAAVQSALTKSRSTAVPSVTGASRVGTRIIDLEDSRRIDPFATNGIKRELQVRFWYPASANRECQLADYTSPRVWSYFSELTKLPLPQVTTNSCLNAPVADGEHPVVVFTHGYTGTFTDYTFLFEDLASRGYIVASIDHTYEATAVEFPDGRFVKSVVGSHLANTARTDDQTLSSALYVRLDDLKFVVNELERLNAATENPLAGKLDLTRVALAGHSLGGLTTWFGVQQDARFKAGILLDPYLPDLPLGSTQTPVMLFTMGHEQQNDEDCQLWSDLRGPRLAVNLRGAEHVMPSDLVWLAKGAIKTGPMGPEKTIAAVRDYVAAFLDTNLRGRPLDRLLTEPSSAYPDAELMTQEQSPCHQR